jgi:hypothetical protein
MLKKPKRENTATRQRANFNTYWYEYSQDIVDKKVKPYLYYFPYHAESCQADNRKAMRYAEMNALFHYLKVLKGESAANEPKISPEAAQRELKDLFSELVTNWNQYFDVFTKTEPPILKKTSTGYRFIGKKRGHSGIIGTFIKKLKDGNIVKPNIHRDTIAKILVNGIEDYRISGASIKEPSALYIDKFAKQLKELTGYS